MIVRGRIYLSRFYTTIRIESGAGQVSISGSFVDRWPQKYPRISLSTVAKLKNKLKSLSLSLSGNNELFLIFDELSEELDD